MLLQNLMLCRLCNSKNNYLGCALAFFPEYFRFNCTLCLTWLETDEILTTDVLEGEILFCNICLVDFKI